MLRAFLGNGTGEQWTLTGESILYVPGILESILQFTPLDCMRRLSELNRYLEHTIGRFFHEMPCAMTNLDVFERMKAAAGTREIWSSYIPTAEIREELALANPSGLSTKHFRRIHQIFISDILSVMNDLRIAPVTAANPVIAENELIMSVTHRAVEEIRLIRMGFPLGVSATTRDDMDTIYAWASLFGGQRSVVSFDEFYGTFTTSPDYHGTAVAAAATPDAAAKMYWHRLIDFPFTGFVTPYKLADLNRRLGPIKDLNANVSYLMANNCYMGFARGYLVASALKNQGDDTLFAVYETHKGVKGTCVMSKLLDAPPNVVASVPGFPNKAYTGPTHTLRQLLWDVRARGGRPLSSHFLAQRVHCRSFGDYSRLHL